ARASSCLFSVDWMRSWKAPAPPEPAERPSWPSLLQPQSLPPRSWLSHWSWSVLDRFETSVVAFDVAVCVALLGPEWMFPPAVETGAFAFTAFWSLLEMPSAHWFVSAARAPAREGRHPSSPAE